MVYYNVLIVMPSCKLCFIVLPYEICAICFFLCVFVAVLEAFPPEALLW